MNKILIPEKCKVGFNIRKDTYTGKLGYVIYNDGKVWRKETSWNGWIQVYIPEEEFQQKKLASFNEAYERGVKRYHSEFIKNSEILADTAAYIEKRKKQSSYHIYSNNYFDNEIGRAKTFVDTYPNEEVYIKKNQLDDISKHHFSIRNTVTDPTVNPFEFKNEPIEGFVLNKNAGGGRGWDGRRTVCRVYDPRGFEIEIGIPNLLYILENANSYKGKGLEGKFVYGWSGKDLVLVPEESPEYTSMLEFTKLQTAKQISKSELVKGQIYIDSNNDKCTFLDEHKKFDYYGYTKGIKLWFSYPNGRIDNRDIKSIKIATGEVDSNYADLMSKLEANPTYNPKVELDTEFELVDSAFLFTQNAQNYWERKKIYLYNPKSKKYKDVFLRKQPAGQTYNYETKQYDNIKESWYVTKSMRSSKSLTEKCDTLSDLLTSYPIYKGKSNGNKEK